MASFFSTGDNSTFSGLLPLPPSTCKCHLLILLTTVIQCLQGLLEHAQCLPSYRLPQELLLQHSPACSSLSPAQTGRPYLSDACWLSMCSHPPVRYSVLTTNPSVPHQKLHQFAAGVSHFSASNIVQQRSGDRGSTCSILP